MKATKLEKRGGGKGRGVHWRWTSRRRRSAGRYARVRARFPQPVPEFGKCTRCGRQFVPDWMEALGSFARCCRACQVRNLARGLGLEKEFAAAGFGGEPAEPLEAKLFNQDKVMTTALMARVGRVLGGGQGR